MYHKQHWTFEKIWQRLELICDLVYRQHRELPPLRYQALPDPAVTPDFTVPLGPDAETLDYHSYWGSTQPIASS